MASVTKEDIPEIARFMSDFWQLVKKYWKPDGTDQYWDALNEEQQQIAQKYDNHLFVIQMLCALTNYLEGIAS